jgi:hypothetical protein
MTRTWAAVLIALALFSVWEGAASANRPASLSSDGALTPGQWEGLTVRGFPGNGRILVSFYPGKFECVFHHESCTTTNRWAGRIGETGAGAIRVRVPWTYRVSDDGSFVQGCMCEKLKWQEGQVIRARAVWFASDGTGRERQSRAERAVINLQP